MLPYGISSFLIKYRKELIPQKNDSYDTGSE